STQARGVGTANMHGAWEAKNREGLEAVRRRWLGHGLEVMESMHHKGWMHSIYTFDPNGLMVECAYVEGDLPERDAIDAFRIFVENQGIDEVGYEREGRKDTTIHLPDPAIEKPAYFASISERLFNMDLESARSLPFISVIQH
ncbi:MAG: hypothetical protein OXG98_09490, partial [Gemmatimonadetes bacterium]|nr:hypothetical protein [Gemmatimonadota bacterium]